MEKRKLTVNLSDEAVTALEAISAQRGVSVTEVLRQAIASEKFLNDEVSKGAKILVERPNQPLREIVLR